MTRRSWIIIVIVLAALVGATVGAWLWMTHSGPRPMLEVIVPQAQVKIGEQVIATVKQGDRLPIYGLQTGWYQVRANGKLGWIYAAHIRRVWKTPRPVDAEILAVHFPDVILKEFARWGSRWVLVEAQVHALQGSAKGAAAIDTHRFVLVLGKKRFYRPRHWATIPVGNHTIDRLENGDIVQMPVGTSQELRLAFSVPSDAFARAGWRLHYLRPKAKDTDGGPAPATE